VASVAIVEDDNLLAEYTTNFKKTHSQTLLPMLDEIVKMLDLDLKELDGIAVAGGPGSFTGLRIGSATAKGLGLALNLPILNVGTLEGLAYNLVGNKGIVCPIMDARRNQVYTGLYRFEGEELIELMPQDALDIMELLEKLKEFDEEVTFLGDGVSVFRETIDGNFAGKHCYAPAHLNKQRAGAVAALGLLKLRKGETETAAMHRPEYLRMAQAEREREEKLKKES